MDPSVRRAVAYIVARALGQGSAGSVFDFGSREHVNFSGQVSDTNVSVYDFKSRCHITGSRNGEQMSLYHYGVSGHLTLSLQADGQFTGYDYSSRSHFNGNVSGQSVTMYDFEKHEHFSYSV